MRPKEIAMRFLLVSCALAAACSSSTTDNFVNPPPGPPPDCALVASLPGCDNGSLSYACGSDRPDGTYVDPDTGVSQLDANLVCSEGTPGGGGATLYCCAPYAQADSECVPDTTLPGCGATAIGFSCSGGDDPPTTPTDADPTIACSAASGSGGARRYCCTTAAVPPTCAVDPAASCGGIAIGYACAGTGAPSASDASLACTEGAAGSDGQTAYCCVPFARDAQTCDEDRGVACAGSAFGFACAGSATPADIAPELACATSFSGAVPGYCCTL
jgi:hypothetical protein